MTAMTEIPVSAAEHLAKTYGYDQVIVFARRCHDSPEPHGEHMTTYGRTKEHCETAGKIGTFLQSKIMGWSEPERYYLSQDSDCHWYVVPVEKKAEWNAWCDLDSDDEAAWEAPDFARAVGGSPCLVTFSDVRIG